MPAAHGGAASRRRSQTHRRDADATSILQQAETPAATPSRRPSISSRHSSLVGGLHVSAPALRRASGANSPGDHGCFARSPGLPPMLPRFAGYVAGLLAPSDTVKMTQAPGATRNQKKMAGVVVALIPRKGGALAYPNPFGCTRATARPTPPCSDRKSPRQHRHDFRLRDALAGLHQRHRGVELGVGGAAQNG